MYIDEALLSDIKFVLGTCSNEALYRRISDAVRLANNQTKGNEWNTAQMDLCVCDGCVTLPADVGTILAVNQGGSPTLIRDQWFQFHINGTGSSDWTSWRYTDELGPVCTFKDPSAPVKLIAVVESQADSNAVQLRVFGWDENGKRIYTQGENGKLEDGFLVPTLYGFSGVNPDAPNIARIDRISKGVSNGHIKLIAVDKDTLESHTLIGYYLPWETSPSYRRIRVPDRNWIRIKYKRKDVDVRGLGDWVNIENRQALIFLCKAIKLSVNDGQIEQAKIWEMEGIKLLSDEAYASRPSAISPPQIIVDAVNPNAENDRLFY